MGTGTFLTAIPWNASWDTEVQSEVADALAVYDPPTNTEMEARTLVAASYATATAQTTAQNDLDILTGTDGVTLATSQPNYAPATSAQAVAIQGATFDTATDSLEAIRNRGDSAWDTATGFSTHSAADVVSALGTGSGLTALATQTSVDDLPTNSELATALGTADDAVLAAITSAHATTDAAIAAVQADLPARITKNTALANFMFKMVLASDHVTPATGFTVTATRSLDGAAFGACANAVSEVSVGWYKIDLAAGDTNGNVNVYKFTAATADTTEIMVVTQNT
jgi:hypothetical protein